MSYALRVALAPLATMSLCCICIAPAPAQGDVSGGVQAPSGGVRAPSIPFAGGTEYGVSTVLAQRPVVGELRIPATANVGRPPRLLLRIDEAGVRTVHVEVSVLSPSSHRPVLAVNMGWVHTGRTLTVGWPRGATLQAGTYQVSVSAHDHTGGTLVRGVHNVGQASLTISLPVRSKTTPPLVPIAGTPPAGVPTPAESRSAGAVFPVAGAHTFGGSENRFGAPRGGRVHQGQDVLTADGTPVLAPMAGMILTTSYQAAGAGYYAVEHTGVGFDFMFAHCQAGSLAVVAGQAVTAGEELCRAGQTGDATTPHLHFEMWLGGWQAAGGYPIDPLPYLEALDRTVAAG